MAQYKIPDKYAIIVILRQVVLDLRDSIAQVRGRLVGATHDTPGFVSADDKRKLDATPAFWVGSQADYDSIATKDGDTVYMIEK